MPSHVDARAALALALINVGRWDEARAEVVEISARDPKHPSLAVLARRLAGAGK
jgi:hypothetical protein